MASHAPGLGPYRAAQLVSVTSLGILFGCTTFASTVVTPSMLAVPLSTYDKLLVIRGIITRTNAIIPPLFSSALASLGYLAYAASPPSTRRNYLLALAAMAGPVLVQIPARPKQRAVMEILDKGEGKFDDGSTGNSLIRHFWKFNWTVWACGGIAFATSLFQILPRRDGVLLPVGA